MRSHDLMVLKLTNCVKLQVVMKMEKHPKLLWRRTRQIWPLRIAKKEMESNH